MATHHTHAGVDGQQARVVHPCPARPNNADTAALAHLPVAAIADVLGKQHVLPAVLRPIALGMAVCGPAITCRGPDVLVRRAAIDLAAPGDVLVVAAGGVTDQACFGSKTAEHMRSLGMAAVVVDGAVRDLADLVDNAFPTYARGVTPRNYDYPVNLADGAVNIAVQIAGHWVHPGDIVRGDDDGLVVVPRLQVAGLAAKVSAAIETENHKWRRRSGRRFGAVDLLRDHGYQVHPTPDGPPA